MFYRPSRMEILTDNLIFNYRLLAQTFAPSHLISVIKADAYGHGMTTVAKALSSAGCRYFAVATVDEALYLRACGLGERILILGATGPGETDEIIRQNLEIAVTDTELVRRLSHHAQRMGRPAKIHLAVDTGMGRIGFLPKQIPELLDLLTSLPGLTLAGMFSHFARADESDRQFMDHQYRKFEPLMKMASKLSPRPMFHIANTAAAIREPRYRLDACRVGMALYGLNPLSQPQLPLRPTFSVKSVVATLRELPKGSSVSYGGNWTAQRDSKIAVIPMGYADGVSRSFSGKLEILIRGHRCPQVGNICMDQMMVDVTDAPQVSTGDEAVLIGQQGDCLITPEQFAAARPHTIVYEVPILFTHRVPRVVIGG